jgi:hypothetical protein
VRFAVTFNADIRIRIGSSDPNNIVSRYMKSESDWNPAVIRSQFVAWAFVAHGCVVCRMDGNHCPMYAEQFWRMAIKTR